MCKEDKQAREGQKGKMWTGIPGRDFGDEVGFGNAGTGPAAGEGTDTGRARKAREQGRREWRQSRISSLTGGMLDAGCFSSIEPLYYV